MSATPTIGDKKCSNSPSREIASLRSQRQFIKQVDSSVGYFANAQYDVLFLHVILNEVKNPTEKVGSIYFISLVVGYFANAQYDVIFLVVIAREQKRRAHRNSVRPPYSSFYFFSSSSEDPKTLSISALAGS